MSLLFIYFFVFVSFSFYEPQNESLKQKEKKVIPYDASTVRIPSLCVKVRFYWGWEILGPPGIIFFIF